MSTIPGRVLVYGGKGALGSACVAHFKRQNYWVAAIDMAANPDADVNVILDKSADLFAQRDQILKDLGAALNDNKLDAVLTVAGGWAGGNAASADFLKNSHLMISQSVNSSLIAADIAAKYLKNNGLLTLTGAQAALDATPGMIGYGMAKAAVHQLTKSLADAKGGLPSGSYALAILPVTLDTPMNRKWMPKGDFGAWTPLEYVAELFGKWIGGERPTNGSLVQLVTKDSKTELIYA